MHQLDIGEAVSTYVLGTVVLITTKDEGADFIAMSQMKRARCRKGREHTQSHTARKWPT